MHHSNLASCHMAWMHKKWHRIPLLSRDDRSLNCGKIANKSQPSWLIWLTSHHLNYNNQTQHLSLILSSLLLACYSIDGDCVSRPRILIINDMFLILGNLWFFSTYMSKVQITYFFHYFQYNTILIQYFWGQQLCTVIRDLLITMGKITLPKVINQMTWMGHGYSHAIH